MNHTARGHLSAIFCVIVWGTTFVSTKVLLNQLTPIEILFIRFTLGFAALNLLYPKRFIVENKHHELLFAAAGLCGVTLYFLLENIALTYTFASNVGIIVSVAPFFTAIVAKIVFKNQHLSVTFYIGFILAMTGIVIISLNGSKVLKLNPLGDILCVTATLFWAFYCAICKKISEFHYNTIQATRRIFLYGILFMVPPLFFMDFSPTLETLLKPTILFNLLFLSLFASALCFVFWNYALKHIGPVKTSVYLYASPVITIAFAAIVLNEPVTKTMVVGTILTLLGLVASQYTYKPKIQTADN